MDTKTLQRQQRVQNILLSLKKLDYLTQRQLQTLHDLKGDRNAHRVMQSMRRYVDSFRNGLELVYHLNKKGREFVDHDVIRKKTMNADHFILRNQLYIALKRPTTWENEVKIKLGDTSIVCDAKYTHKGVPVFIEADVSQPMMKNKAKIEKYRKFQEAGQQFHLIWVTALESRKPKLQELMKGISGAVYSANEIK